MEIKIPRDVAKSPKAMESIFAGIHGTMRSGNLITRLWEGFQPAWFSLEIVGDETGVHFYIWTQAFFKKLIESQIYAQYPSVEIREAEDYTANLPKSVPDKDWDLWGTEMLLAMPDAYPIRTYEDFPLEDITLKEEERKIDPLAAFVEFLGNLNEGEKVWTQILIKPTGDAWKKEGEKLVAKIAGRPVKIERTVLSSIIGGIESLVIGILGLGGTGEAAPKKEDKPFGFMLLLTPGEQEVVKAIEKNMAKLGFQCGLRWLYLAKKDRYNAVAVPALMGIYKQFASQSLNGFKPNTGAMTSIDYWFVKSRLARRKHRLYKAFKARSYFYYPYRKFKPFILSSSELATVYHFPGTVAGAPSMERIGAKKGAPPPNLPI